MPQYLVEALRLTNIGLSAIACHLLVVTMVRRWDSLTRRLRRITPWLCALLAYICYGTGESLALDVEPGPRIPVLTVVLIGLIWSILWRFNEDLPGSNNWRSSRHN